jgi:hypothetical protein
MEARQQARAIEITIISGQNICVDRNSKADDIYVVVRTDSLNSCTTKMAKQNEDLLSWNEKFKLHTSHAI